MVSVNRRDFLLGSAAAGALSLASCHATGRRPSPNDRLRIAQIGCGGKGYSDMQAAAKNHDIIALPLHVYGKWHPRHNPAADYEEFRERATRAHRRQTRQSFSAHINTHYQLLTLYDQAPPHDKQTAQAYMKSGGLVTGVV